MQDFDELDKALGLNSPFGSKPQGEQDPFALGPDGRRLADGKSKNGSRAKEYVKPTQEEIEKRIDICVQYLGRKTPKSVIKQRLNVLYGVGPRTVEAYLSRARKKIMQAVGRTRADLVADSVATYTAIIADPDTSASDRIRAQERIDKVLGLEAAFKVDVSIDQPPDVIEVVVENREELGEFVRFRELMQQQQQQKLLAQKKPVGDAIAPDVIDVEAHNPDEPDDYSDLAALDEQEHEEQEAGPPPDDAPTLGTTGEE